MAKKRKFPYTLKGFASWLRTKPRDAQYNYISTCGCAAAQFHNAVGLPYRVGNPDQRTRPSKMAPANAIEKVAVNATPTGSCTGTFGAALAIAERAIKTDSWR